MASLVRSLVPLGVLLLAGAACSDSHSEKKTGGATTPDAGAPAATPSYDVGALGIHRLNAAEYDNTVRDLLGDTTGFAKTFPPDDGADSFTNIADALSISPLLFEKYEHAAESLAIAAVRNPSVVACAPTESDVQCITSVLASFLPRAFRRTTTSDEQNRYVQIAQTVMSSGGSRGDGLQAALQAALLSPYFLFRIEADPKPGDTTPHALDDFALASRLSYFLWSTMPDDVLFQYAKAGRLSSPDVFDREVARMLADPKAQTLLDSFATPWLLHAFDTAAPDTMLYGQWSDELRSDMRAETREFLASFLFENQDFADVLDARFSFLNARLATHYGVANGPTGIMLQRVQLPPGSHRGGLLTHASVLTMTSVATRTSPVRRGEWVLAELLCSPPPPPPPGVPPLEATISVGTMRQRMEAHRKNPVCATCHSQMDPIGFALEHYDAIGQWRDTDQGMPIDASGQLPGGPAIDGEAQLAAAVKSDPRFSRCATRKMFTFALGRVVSGFDEARLIELTNRFNSGGHRLRALITDIVHTDAFRMRHGK